jgi:hypothetical protein
MKLQINQPVQGNDLAQLLEGDEGTFLCQNGGKNFVTIAKAGHSIAYGPTPVGRPVQEATPAIGIEPWTVTKLSNSTEMENEFTGRGEREHAARSRS